MKPMKYCDCVIYWAENQQTHGEKYSKHIYQYINKHIWTIYWLKLGLMVKHLHLKHVLSQVCGV